MLTDLVSEGGVKDDNKVLDLSNWGEQRCGRLQEAPPWDGEMQGSQVGLY